MSSNIYHALYQVLRSTARINHKHICKLYLTYTPHRLRVLYLKPSPEALFSSHPDESIHLHSHMTRPALRHAYLPRNRYLI